jgi:Uma2 family endonuclease
MSVTARDLARIHRHSVEEYQRMGETGILGPELRTELIEGEIVEMTPIGPEHAGTVKFLNARLVVAVGECALVSTQDPVTLTPFSEPQPDLALLCPRNDFYRGANPRPEDVLLLIEVADSSLRYDRDLKLPLYARAGIPEVWLVDLTGRCLTRYRGPGEEGYREQEVLADLSQLTLPIEPEVALDLSDLF